MLVHGRTESGHLRDTKTGQDFDAYTIGKVEHLTLPLFFAGFFSEFPKTADVAQDNHLQGSKARYDGPGSPKGPQIARKQSRRPRRCRKWSMKAPPGRHQAAKTKEKMEMVFAPSPLWGPERSTQPEGRQNRRRMARKSPEEVETAYNLLLVILYIPLVPLPILLLLRLLLLLLLPTPPYHPPSPPSHPPSPSSSSRSSIPSFFSTPLAIPPPPLPPFLRPVLLRLLPVLPPSRSARGHRDREG